MTTVMFKMDAAKIHSLRSSGYATETICHSIGYSDLFRL